MSATYGVEPNRLVPYGPLLHGALGLATHKVTSVIMKQRTTDHELSTTQSSTEPNSESGPARARSLFSLLSSLSSLSSPLSLYFYILGIKSPSFILFFHIPRSPLLALPILSPLFIPFTPAVSFQARCFWIGTNLNKAAIALSRRQLVWLSPVLIRCTFCTPLAPPGNPKECCGILEGT